MEENNIINETMDYEMSNTDNTLPQADVEQPTNGEEQPQMVAN